MASSIVILKTGEQIICDLKEVYEGEGEEKRGICLLMRHPYSLSLVQVENTDNPQQNLVSGVPMRLTSSLKFHMILLFLME
jgi:hypothetical protein